jgi:hypothetical protein
MTDTADPTDTPTLIDRAHRALDNVEGIATRMADPDERLKAMATGAEPGAQQRAFLLHAATLALLSIAESLHELAADTRTP